MNKVLATAFTGGHIQTSGTCSYHSLDLRLHLKFVSLITVGIKNPFDDFHARTVERPGRMGDKCAIESESPFGWGGYRGIITVSVVSWMPHWHVNIEDTDTTR